MLAFCDFKPLMLATSPYYYHAVEETNPYWIERVVTLLTFEIV